MTIIYLINHSTSKLFSEVCNLDKPKTIATRYKDKTVDNRLTYLGVLVAKKLIFQFNKSI